MSNSYILHKVLDLDEEDLLLLIKRIHYYRPEINMQATLTPTEILDECRGSGSVECAHEKYARICEYIRGTLPVVYDTFNEDVLGFIKAMRAENKPSERRDYLYTYSELQLYDKIWRGKENPSELLEILELTNVESLTAANLYKRFKNSERSG